MSNVTSRQQSVNDESSPLIVPTHRIDIKGNTSRQKNGWDVKMVAFVFVGVITLLYVIGELGVAMSQNSLVLLSDGFHNLSDVFSLYIAYWARKASKWDPSQKMSYGWARSETLGALTNGMFLLSLCLYVILQTIPRFYQPEPVENSLSFIIVAAAGLVINTAGTIIFKLTGQGHTHSHGGGHSHGHDHGHDHGHSEDKEKEGHSHSHEKKKKKSHEHGHSHEKKNDKKDDHGHSHSHKKKNKKEKHDANTHAVFLHYLGDAISSLMVLIAGVFLYFFKGNHWVDYIDPVTSLLVVALILWTTIPLVKTCSLILLQSTPTHIDPDKVKKKVMQVPGIINLHDFHVWQLVDGLVICSIHVSVEEGVDFVTVVDEVKKIFHKFGIHSSAIQPEFIHRDSNGKYNEFCVQNCVEDCKEDWCCKNASEGGE